MTPAIHAFLGGGLIGIVVGLSIGYALTRPFAPTHVARIRIADLKRHIDLRLDAHVSVMKPDYDDSVTGFNEAWDIVRAEFDRALR